MTVVLDAESHAFPRDLLADCESAFLLFCSGRMGAADGHWVREAGLTDVTCVDWDEKTLEPFQAAYPSEWSYVRADIFDFLRDSFGGRRWDIVSADAPSQLGSELPNLLPSYCSISSRYVVATMSSVDGAVPEVPAVGPRVGWRYLGDPVFRTEWEGRRYWWLVLERA